MQTENQSSKATEHAEEENLQRRRWERIARTKRILRWMPRRSNVHKYPGLKWCARTAKKRLYLWSFRTNRVTPALYAGCILAFWPLYGIQIPLAFLLALILRANLPVLVSLQFITNPITLFPVYFSTYQVGRIFLSLFGFEPPHLKMSDIHSLVDPFNTGQWVINLRYFITVWSITALGGTILGSFTGLVSSVMYRFLGYEVATSYNRLKHLQTVRKAKAREAQREAENSKPKTPAT